MKNLLLLLIACLFFSAVTAQIPTRVRKADQAQWLLYSAYCRTMVPDTIQQPGSRGFEHVTEIKTDFTTTNGTTYHAGDRYYFWNEPIDTIWYFCKCKDYKENSLNTRIQPYTITVPNRVFFLRPKICLVRQRRATVKDFYEHWMLGNLDYYKYETISLTYRIKLVE